MKANLSKSLIPAVLVIAGLAAGTGLLAGYVDGPGKAPQAAVVANCDGCPRLNTPECCKITGICADPQNCTTPCCIAEGCTSPCPVKPCANPPCENPAVGCPRETLDAPCPAAGCTMEKPQPTGCPFMRSASQTASPCGAGGCTQAK